VEGEQQERPINLTYTIKEEERRKIKKIKKEIKIVVSVFGLKKRIHT